MDIKMITPIRRNLALFEACTELVISFLPMIVVFLVMQNLGMPEKVFSKPEWAFGAVIFFGQSLVRLVSAMASPHKEIQRPRVAFFTAAVLVFGLVPALLFLVFVINHTECHASVPIGYQVAQTLMFVVSAITYMVVGIVTHELTSNIADKASARDPSVTKVK